MRRDVQFIPMMFVAVQSGAITGFVSGEAIREPVPRFDAELYGIYLLQSAQRTGLGTDLMRQLASRLADLGHHSLIVRVLADTPARCFYMQMGGTLVAEGVHTVDGQPYPKRTYGYADLVTLAREASVFQAFAAVGA